MGREKMAVSVNLIDQLKGEMCSQNDDNDGNGSKNGTGSAAATSGRHASRQRTAFHRRSKLDTSYNWRKLYKYNSSLENSTKAQQPAKIIGNT